MDPFTQGALGAIAAQAGSKPSLYLKAAAIGALGGMVPDLDVLIRSGSDPLLTLEYHRQFTHALIMIPVLGGLAGLLAWGLLGRRWNFALWQAVLWATLGCATHGVLDGFTSYGTQLLWPFSDRRISWDLISVVDPLFTLPLIAAVALAAWRHSARWVLAGIVWVFLYLGFAFVQHQRAMETGRELAEVRGPGCARLEAKPAFGNLLVWKIVCESGRRFYVDAVKPGWGSRAVVWRGGGIDRLDVDRDFPWLAPDSRQRRDIDRFSEYSSGFVAVDPDDPLRIFDVRYSMLPQQIDPMWGIALSPEKNPDQHVDYFAEREDGAAALNQLLEMIAR